MVRSAVFSTLLTTCVLHVTMTHENDGQQSFHFFRHRCLSRQLRSCTTVVYIETRPPRYTKVCTHFTSTSQTGTRRLSILDNEVTVLHLRLPASPSRQLSSASSGKTCKRIPCSGPGLLLLQTSQRRRPYQLESMPPTLQLITIQIFLHDLWRRCVPSFSIASVASV